jgi:hypothetical protein
MMAHFEVAKLAALRRSADRGRGARDMIERIMTSFLFVRVPTVARSDFSPGGVLMVVALMGHQVGTLSIVPFVLAFAKIEKLTCPINVSRLFVSERRFHAFATLSCR